MAPNGAVVDSQYTSAPELLDYNDATRFPNNVVKGLENVSYYFDLLSCFSRKDRDADDYTEGGYGSDFNPCSSDCGYGQVRRLLGDYPLYMTQIHANDGCLYGKEGDADCDFRCGNIFGAEIWDDGAPFLGTFVETSFTAYNSGFWQELQYEPSEDYDEDSSNFYSAGATFMVNVQVDRYGRALKYTSYNQWNPTEGPLGGVTHYSGIYDYYWD